MLMTVGDWLALHDISHDYVSPTVIAAHAADAASSLPAWTATESEWHLVNLSGLTRIIAFVVTTVTLGLCLRSHRANVVSSGA